MGNKIYLHHDFETWSRCNLKLEGLSRYMRHKSTEPLMCSFAFNKERPDQWVPAEGQRIPRDLKDAIRDPDVIKVAWNAPFEMGCWTHLLKYEIDVSQWRDAMVLASTLSFPMKLDKACDALELDDSVAKMKAGKSLVRYFTVPRRPTKTKLYDRNTHKNSPVKWELFKDYNWQDTIAEREIFYWCLPWDLPEDEWENWFMDQDINGRGVPINLKMVRNGLKLIDHYTDDRLNEMEKITRLENANSGDQLLPWLQDQGYPFIDLKKGHVKRALDDWREGDDEDYRDVLQMRLDVNRAAVKKYNAFWNMTDNDGNFRYSVQFAGAGRTWRYSGRGPQVHNLLRPEAWVEKEQEFLAWCIEHFDPYAFQIVWGGKGVDSGRVFDAIGAGCRPIIQANDGYVFVDADLNAIENRVLGWMAMDRRILRVFERGLDPYVDFGTYLFHEKYQVLHDEWKGGNKRRRQLAKPPVLGCGYMLGAGTEFENERTGEIEATGLLGYARNMGVDMTKDESKYAVGVWRDTFTDVTDFWKGIDKAARRCLRTGDRVLFEVFEFDISGPFMRMRLPSGRYLHYYKPKILSRRTPWGEMRPTITYMNQNDKGQFVRVSTHPGKLTENGDQAIARDLLVHGMKLAYKRGLDIRLHVHDQIVGLCKEHEAEKWLALLLDSMKVVPKWGGKTLPLDAGGSISKVFIKD